MPDVPDGVVHHYEANVTLVEALAKSFGFRPLFFWQPTVFTKRVLVAGRTRGGSKIRLGRAVHE